MLNWVLVSLLEKTQIVPELVPMHSISLLITQAPIVYSKIGLVKEQMYIVSYKVALSYRKSLML